MTASERFKAASASCTVHDGLCRECAIAAILAHAQAVQEEVALRVERWPTECNCSAPDIGVGVLHEPGCGLPHPKEVAATIRAIVVT